MNALAQNLKRLRILSGLSQVEISSKAGISRAAYTYLEAGKNLAKKSTLESLAQVFGVSSKSLLVETPQLTHIRFRSHKRIKSRETVTYQVSESLKHYRELEELLQDQQETPVLPTNTDPRRSAQATRSAFGLQAEEPILDICGLLEHNGFKVLPLNIVSTDFWGMSVGKEDGGSCVVVNCFEKISVESWIFSAAHELAHLVLHQNSFSSEYKEEDQKEEDDANLFAGEFLMPEIAFQKAWEEAKGLDPVDRVIKIKHKFHVSYQTVLMRLQQNGARDVWSNFAAIYEQSTGQPLKGRTEIEGSGPEVFSKTMRSEEIVSLNQHHFGPSRLGRLVRTALERELISVEYASQVLNKSVEEMTRLADGWQGEESLAMVLG
jgi:Zn-dependent peptidase ImmA (M78 family)